MSYPGIGFNSDTLFLQLSALMWLWKDLTIKSFPGSPQTESSGETTTVMPCPGFWLLIAMPSPSVSADTTLTTQLSSFWSFVLSPGSPTVWSVPLLPPAPSTPSMARSMPQWITLSYNNSWQRIIRNYLQGHSTEIPFLSNVYKKSAIFQAKNLFSFTCFIQSIDTPIKLNCPGHLPTQQRSIQQWSCTY
jgi:hypothetical protein